MLFESRKCVKTRRSRGFALDPLKKLPGKTLSWILKKVSSGKEKKC